MSERRNNPLLSESRTAYRDNDGEAMGARDSVSLIDAASSPADILKSNGPGRLVILDDPLLGLGSGGFYNSKPTSPKFKEESKHSSNVHELAEADEPLGSQKLLAKHTANIARLAQSFGLDLGTDPSDKGHASRESQQAAEEVYKSVEVIER